MFTITNHHNPATNNQDDLRTFVRIELADGTIRLYRFKNLYNKAEATKKVAAELMRERKLHVKRLNGEIEELRKLL